jgi:hypothetical protein
MRCAEATPAKGATNSARTTGVTPAFSTPSPSDDLRPHASDHGRWVPVLTAAIVAFGGIVAALVAGIFNVVGR